MSPEQVQGRVVDERSDVFSAGAVFYQLITGRKPFAANALPMVLHRVVTEDPPLSDRDAPPELTRIIRRALEKDPRRRYQHMQEMQVDLTRFGQRFEQQTRQLAVKVAERCREIEGLLQARAAAAAELGIAIEPERLAIADALQDLPLFEEMGGDVLRAVPFSRARIQQFTVQLDAQYESLIRTVAAWRSALERWRAAEAAGTGPGRDAVVPVLEVLAVQIPEATKIREAIERWRSGQGADIPVAPAAVTTVTPPPDARAGADEKARAQAEREQRAAAAREAMAAADAMLARGSLDQAERMLSDLLERDPSSEAARDRLARVRQQIQERAELRVRERLERDRSRAARPILRAARTALSRGDAARAAWAAECALALHPAGAEARDLLARAREATGGSARGSEVLLPPGVSIGEADTLALPAVPTMTSWVDRVADLMSDVRQRFSSRRVTS
jgi:hypothetical protein